MLVKGKKVKVMLLVQTSVTHQIVCPWYQIHENK